MTRRAFGKHAFVHRKKRFVKTPALPLLGTLDPFSAAQENFYHNNHVEQTTGCRDGLE